MGRALVRDPAIFLMDEPLSNLDASLRVQMRAEVLQIQRRVGVATLYVTHDQTEAMTMGDRVAVMRDGVLQQLAPPREIYDSPANLFVAAFMGSPSMNLYEATMAAGADGPVLVLGLATAGRAQARRSERGPRRRRATGRAIVVGIRPEDLTPGRAAAGRCWPSTSSSSRRWATSSSSTSRSTRPNIATPPASDRRRGRRGGGERDRRPGGGEGRRARGPA